MPGGCVVIGPAVIGPAVIGPAVSGLAGGIASGKSRVARAFGALGCVVVDSDREARAALERPEVIEELVALWGEDVLDANGAIDRRRVATIVFEDPAKRERLEGLIHPMIKRTRAQVIREAEAKGAPGVIIDAPLLFEAGLDAECDATVFVESPRDVRVRRVVEHRGWDEAELDRRERAQMPIDEKRARCDHVVVNDGTADVDARVREVFRAILEGLEKRHGA